MVIGPVPGDSSRVRQYPEPLHRHYSLPASGSWQAEALTTNLLGLLTAEINDRLLALRDQQCWVQCFEPFHLPANKPQKPVLRPVWGLPHHWRFGWYWAGSGRTPGAVPPVGEAHPGGPFSLPPRVEWGQIVDNEPETARCPQNKPRPTVRGCRRRGICGDGGCV